MKFTTEELDVWTKGGNIKDVYFVVIKVPNCPKCDRLQGNAEKVFGKMNEYVRYYTYSPKETLAAEIFANLNLTSAPAILYRFRDGGKFQLSNIHWTDDDYTDLTCIFDAISDKDHAYFGFDHLGNQRDKDAQYDMNRLLHTIHGEADAMEVNNFRIMKNEVNN